MADLHEWECARFEWDTIKCQWRPKRNQNNCWECAHTRSGHTEFGIGGISQQFDWKQFSFQLRKAMRMQSYNLQTTTVSNATARCTLNREQYTESQFFSHPIQPLVSNAHFSFCSLAGCVINLVRRIIECFGISNHVENLAVYNESCSWRERVLLERWVLRQLLCRRKDHMRGMLPVLPDVHHQSGCVGAAQ